MNLGGETKYATGNVGVNKLLFSKKKKKELIFYKIHFKGTNYVGTYFIVKEIQNRKNVDKIIHVYV